MGTEEKPEPEQRPEKRQKALKVSNIALGPLGGRTKLCIDSWKKITTNKFILQCVQGCKIDFTSPPFQTKLPHQIKMNNTESQALEAMIKVLEEEKVIEKTVLEHGDFVNNVFLREKKVEPGEDIVKKYRIILNVKRLNTFVKFVHFKMDTLDTCLNLMTPGCYMASLDLSNAYHTVPFHSEFTKFLKFKVGSQFYKYLVLPQGFRDSPRIFTKILKPILTHLRQKNFISSVYIDDFFLQGATFKECLENVEYTKPLLEGLGFDLSAKSVLEPTQQLHHLGFILDSTTMTVSLGEQKKKHIKDMIKLALKLDSSLTVRNLAQLIGTLVASFPAITYGPLFYRSLECIKINTLARHYNFDNFVSLSETCKQDLRWWLEEGIHSRKPISHGNPDVIIHTDSSSYAWGAVRDDSFTQGMWSQTEKNLHINVLEIKGAMLGIQALCKDLSHCHIQVQIDNTTAVAYINNMGGTHSAQCNDITRELLFWCKQRDIWLSSCHIAGKDNVRADYCSRKCSSHTEWMLDTNIFKSLCIKFGKPSIDMFASRSNAQLPQYISYLPDPQAVAVDAFHHKWDKYIYLFPPFILINRVLRKIIEDKTPRALIIVPEWPSQAWYPQLVKMLMAPPVKLPKTKTLLKLPSDEEATHPLFPHLTLMACLLSGNL